MKLDMSKENPFEDKCYVCKYYLPHPFGDYRVVVGKCLRNAPVYVKDDHSVWPAVTYDQWCGEFAPNAEVANERAAAGGSLKTPLDNLAECVSCGGVTLCADEDGLCPTCQKPKVSDK